MRKFVSFFAVICLFASFAAAQKSKAPQKSAGKWEVFAGYTFDRSFGDINSFNETSATKGNIYSPFNLNGGQVTAAYFPWKHVGVKAAFTYGRKQGAIAGTTDVQATLTNRSYLVGPVARWTVPHFYNGRVNLFAHELFGANHISENLDVTSGSSVVSACNANGESCRASGFATVTGGGIDVRIYRNISIRPAELDYWNHQVNFAHFSGDTATGLANFNSTANGFRYSAGASVNF